MAKIIIKKKPEEMVSPFVRDEVPKTFISKQEEAKYWETEFKRWHDGHNGIAPSHYFLLSQCLIKKPNNKREYPDWRDWDAVLHEKYMNDRKYGNDLFVFKRRRFALSTVFGGSEPIRIALTNPGAICGLTSCDVPRGKQMVKEKLEVAFYGLSQQINLSRLTAQEVNNIKKDNGISEHLQFRKATGSRDGSNIRIEFLEDLQPTGDVSEIMYKQTSRKEDDSTAFEGGTLNYIFLDEFFLHPYANKVRSSSEACMLDGFTKVGMFVAGGSCGAMSTEGIQNAIKVIEDSNDVGSRTSVLFLPGTACIDKAPVFDEKGNVVPGKELSFMRNGISLEKEAEEWILKNREVLKKSSDPTKLKQFVKAYPLTLEELLEASSEGLISQDIADMFPKQEKNILNQREKIFVQYRVIWNSGSPQLVSM
jgi:hypothetical protein